MGALFELLRVCIILVFGGGIGWMIARNLYIMNNADADTMWMGAIAVFLSLFVLYRNKLQFSGWYKGNSKEKLPKAVSFVLILLSFILLITPLLISFVKS
ncbi:hypothetical protein PGH26_07495 [Sporosarcina jeotgali]|uniref:Uncharacterized protein n=1 Tax=Sporosarcina jeotgali TaxID=3020056 RepID=A0ABZ0L1H2_9BACL|nr:hypothetical protein [Sporosarcina sp. B2O-1]WOV85768.1 hypothetical protein PGH26_07495 [Sporosarcina sp. B2O-1]